MKREQGLKNEREQGAKGKNVKGAGSKGPTLQSLISESVDTWTHKQSESILYLLKD